MDFDNYYTNEEEVERAAHLEALEDDLRTMREERDDVRRELCFLLTEKMAQETDDPRVNNNLAVAKFVAQRRGWNCFDALDNTKPN